MQKRPEGSETVILQGSIGVCLHSFIHSFIHSSTTVTEFLLGWALQWPLGTHRQLHHCVSLQELMVKFHLVSQSVFLGPQPSELPRELIKMQVPGLSFDR